MEFFLPRKLKFKAWNIETKLMMRLHSIDCAKGELVKKNHILLQFTGLYDKQGEEIYEMDVLLKDSVQYAVCWQNELNSWGIVLLPDKLNNLPLQKNFAETTMRLCNYFELKN